MTTPCRLLCHYLPAAHNFLATIWPLIEIVRSLVCDGLVAVVAPKISCWSVAASLGQRDVTVTCTLLARPRLTSLFWIIAANGTTITDTDAHNRHFRANTHVRVISVIMACQQFITLH